MSPSPDYHTPEGSEVDELEYANRVAEHLLFLARNNRISKTNTNGALLGYMASQGLGNTSDVCLWKSISQSNVRRGGGGKRGA